MRRNATRLLLALLTLVAVGLAGWNILTQWRAFRASGAHLVLQWPLILLSSALVATAYAVLIETWRRTVRSWDAELPWGVAARIWFVSNLGRYLPGKVWQIGAMGVLAREAGVSPVAAAGSALVINLVNVLAGFGLVLITGSEFFEAPRVAIALAVALAVGIALAPRLIPVVGRAAGRLLRRRIDVPVLPDSAVWLACIGCLLAWILYGIAFQVFVAGVLGQAPGRTASYIAAFTGSYLAGYIVLFAPGGIGVREGSLILALSRFGLAQSGAAGVISLTSRLWLTVLEVLPGLALLALGALRGRRTSVPPS